MTMVVKTIRRLALSGALSLALAPGLTHAATPAFYHYYYVYPNSMTWCGKLVEEVFDNTNKNWNFTKKSIKTTTASFSVGNVRGFLRCLAKGSKESWVVIIATGNDGTKTKDLFEELRVGICGKCSAWVD
jgi:hypothetical protein